MNLIESYTEEGTATYLFTSFLKHLPSKTQISLANENILTLKSQAILGWKMDFKDTILYTEDIISYPKLLL